MERLAGIGGRKKSIFLSGFPFNCLKLLHLFGTFTTKCWTKEFAAPYVMMGTHPRFLLGMDYGRI